MRQLTPKQQLFVNEYLVDLNAKRAAIRAGYSARNADSIGIQLLRKTQVSAAISEAFERRSKKIGVNADLVLARLVEEANADIADLFDEAGVLKPPREWPEVWRRGLITVFEREVKPDGTRTYHIRFSDRLKRLELIGRHVQVGAFKEKVEHDVTDPIKKLYEQISGRSIRPKE